MVAPQQTLTLEEFLRLPEKKPALEFEDGRITQKLSPTTPHARLQNLLAWLITTFAEPPRLAAVFTELRVTIARRSWVPDVCVYRWERLPLDERGELLTYPDEPPDIAIEIISPRQPANMITRRCLIYVANGVQIAVSVDATDRSVMVYRPDTVPRDVTGDERIDLSDVLTGFELTAAQLFAGLRFR